MSRRMWGNVLLVWGLLAWAVYYGLKLLAAVELPFPLVLAWHLSGVIPGASLRGSGRLKRLVETLRDALRRLPDAEDAS
jgi:hypothetical protein